jgi:hypothetical protein
MPIKGESRKMGEPVTSLPIKPGTGHPVESRPGNAR